MSWSNAEALSIVRKRESTPQKPFLVFLVPRGDMPSPLLGLEPDNRNFDLAVRFYDDPGRNASLLTEAEFVMTGGLSKFHAASLFLEECDFKNTYDGYLFLDGDLEFDASRLSNFLSFVRSAEFDLAQPSVTRDSYCYWKMAYHQAAYAFRETSFVEVMAPYLSRDALLKVLPTFTKSISTYGLDLVWPSIIGSGRIGVVDAFQIRHRERVDHASGSFYKYLKSIGVDLELEELQVLEEYGVTVERAHSLRGYRFNRGRGGRETTQSLVSVPLHEIEKKTNWQWIIDSFMRLAALGPSRQELTELATIRASLEKLTNSPQEN